MTAVFKTDIDFCPECGTIVPLPHRGYIAECVQCKFKINISKYMGVKKETTIVFNQRRDLKDDASRVQASEGALIEHRCNKCDNEQMLYTTMQTRSVDEGQTIFYTCPKCGFQESEFS